MVEVAKEKTLAEIAQEEIKQEMEEKAKKKLKDLYRELHAAKKIVANIEREIEDYLLEIEEW